ncbi:urea ABC transporter permease subunit UrtB [Pseudooceanicola spongiae]|uniref:Urea ABC transporter permease subunit UrtB n=1 Tax=Pseudooceanicola spongiae TaxID=2613965 RepID=A0A7L9WHX4_9RHOB|nr:urea ABC transporter permease subunit UrtB [Pseudooceanicola spongiae]QOL79473.1 urea ABC transporter permease subunit UrtB [Pseudooceanicola spongiae]
MIKRISTALALVVGLAFATLAPVARAQDASIQPILQANAALIVESSRVTIQPAIDAVAASGLAQAPFVLVTWADRDMWQRKADGLFFKAVKNAKQYDLIDFDTGAVVATVDKDAIDQLKPNSGIRAVIAVALVKFQLTDPNPAKRAEALDAIERNGEQSHLAPLRDSIASETDPGLKARKEHLETLLTIRFDADTATRIAAIEKVAGDTGVDVRATLNPLVATTLKAAKTLPDAKNVARQIKPGSEILSREAAYQLLVAEGLAPRLLNDRDLRDTLTANIVDGAVGGVPVAELGTNAARNRAYDALVAAGTAEAAATTDEIDEIIDDFTFYETYSEPNSEVTQAANAALHKSALKVGLMQFIDLCLDALSLGSIYFLAAIGLAITFGVMGVINMAHGEFIMMGAYTGYVVQQIIPNYTVSIIVAIPLAFAVTFAAGVAMERLVIRWLYSRPLETLLATFGISIALQQLAKNIFGTQARPLTSPAWLDGGLVINDVVGISYIRIAIFVLALIFLCLFLFIMKKTRLGLETRAVTQNPKMAASMGINPEYVNMLTFGLGSGIAGIAGVAIGLYAKVTSELGQDYIVQSFMTVVVGGVGNIWGTLFGALMIGSLQKGIEWFNPSNTLAAQTYMIIFIIIFIQFRPRGIIALKGRAAGD